MNIGSTEHSWIIRKAVTIMATSKKQARRGTRSVVPKITVLDLVDEETGAVDGNVRTLLDLLLA